MDKIKDILKTDDRCHESTGKLTAIAVFLTY
nr:MAG TPA: hypothetical protein [Caudoviricetes sp.]